MALLKGLTGPGFERVCQLLVREAGFEEVKLTRASGGGGMDGEGRLVVNQFVSFKVVFQCKKHSVTASPDVVRDFRGTMEGRADKGIIVTTGVFTRQAKEDAARDGARQIELVDGKTLLDMCEIQGYGLTPVSTYEVDRAFFEPFK